MTGEASIAGARPGTPMQDTPDPYPVEAKRTAAMVAERLALLGCATGLVFRLPEPGRKRRSMDRPTVEETLKALRDEGHMGMVMQPVGFLCDHVEILYDIDIAFREMAEELGMKLWRAESLNDSPVLTQTLVEIVRGTGTAAGRLQQARAV